MRTANTIQQIALFILVFVLQAGQRAQAQNGNPTIDELQQYLQQHHRSPEAYIIDKFKDHDVILLSEDHAVKHNLQMAHDIIPALYKAGIYNFGVEFGAFEDQALTDSLVTAPEYNEEIAKQIMFNYNVGWVFPEYRDLYKAAWTLNRSLPANARKFRILNISYQYNWADCDDRYFGIRTVETYNKIFNKGNTEVYRADMIKKQILDKGEKVLVLCGFGHAYTRYNTPYLDYRETNFYRFDTHRMGNILYAMAPKRVFTILLHYPFEGKTYGPMTLYPPAGGAIDAVMQRFSDKRVGFDLANTPFGALKDTSQYSIGYPDFRLRDMADGYIYQKPFSEYEGCTVDRSFFTDANWPEVKRNFPDKDIDRVPDSKEAYLEKISRYVDLKWRYRNLQIAKSAEGSAIVQTGYGKVRGAIHEGIYTYKAIPYAQAERFMLPKPPAEWNGVRSCLAYGPVCPQTGPNVIDQSEYFFHHDFGYPGEDCLRLNIWSPGINTTQKRPVMIWLHGGGFATGSGNELPSYDGENLSRKGNVVVVGVNHRLNVLGFLNLSSFGEPFKYSANLGMLDLVAALKWVKDNIARFGGDPGNITIFGQSGGGRKVCTLLTMPDAKGLFNKGIIESGASLELYANSESQRIGELVVKELGLDATTVDSLRKIPYELIRAAGERVLSRLNKEYEAQGKTIDGFRLRWGPTVDGKIIPFQPTDDQANAIMSDIPLIIGSTKNEFVQAFNTPEFINPSTEKEAKTILSPKYGNLTDEYIRLVKQAYPDAKRPLDLLELDSRGRSSTIRLANLKANLGKVYTYLFTWESPVLDGRFRSCHCLELPFVFNNVGRCTEMTGGGRDACQLADRMSQAWINFARNGDPNHPGLPNWTPYTAANGATMIFDNNCKTVFHHDQALIDLAAKIR